MLLGGAGIALLLYGAWRMLTQLDGQQLERIAIWLVAAVALHDGVLAPVTGGVGLLTGRIPARARAYVQGALAAGALVTAVAFVYVRAARVPQPAQKALLRQDFTRNLSVLLAVVAVGAVLLYLLRVARDHRRSDRNRRPRSDQSSSTR